MGLESAQEPETLEKKGGTTPSFGCIQFVSRNAVKASAGVAFFGVCVIMN
jgi:hypothetical protein